MYGLLLGKQIGRNVEIVNSFELKVAQEGGHGVIDEEFFTQREALCKFEMGKSPLSLIFRQRGVREP